jgi:DNA polymerase-3 subunit gamma/tau
LEKPKEDLAMPAPVDQPGAEPLGLTPEAVGELNQALLLKTWNAYAKARKKEGKSSLHATLVANSPSIAGPRAITFAIGNVVQENYMREEKPALLGYLQREMGISGLELQVLIQEIKDLRPRYTPKDRFNIMAEKNPELQKLRQDLDLDLG